MSDCSTNAWKAPDVEWRELPDGRAVAVPRGGEAHLLEVRTRSGAELSWPFSTEAGDGVESVTLDGVRLVAAPTYEERCEVMEIDG